MNAKAVLAVLCAILLLGSSSFVLDASGGQRPDPVAFDDTITMGMTGVSVQKARAGGYEIPRAQVFYSGYRYVVGFYGVESLVGELKRPGQDRQFGRPLTIYVSDFSGTNVDVTPVGYLRVPDHDVESVGWVPATEASFVVDSRARVPGTDSTIVPFGTPADAERFATQYGGTVTDWATLQTVEAGTTATTSEQLQAAVANQSAWADNRVEATSRLLDRPVSVVVGDDAPTVSAAVDRAPPNTTVLVPAGTYDANVTVDKPVTILGVGTDTHLVGDGTGTVVTVRSRAGAVADLRISGVGNVTSPDVPRNETQMGQWDYMVQLGYGFGDAGVALVGANASVVSGVSIETPANGVLVRNSPQSVVDDVHVQGSADWREGFMGVMAMHSRIVVEDSTFVQGRDGVYTHFSNGLVVRDNRMIENRFGVHEMYTSDALVANNTVRDTDIGIVVMTGPTGNLLVGNDVRGSYGGINVAGTRSYVAENVVVDNRYGLQMPSKRSLYEHNTIVENEIGVRASSLIPTNEVVANDVVDNDRPVVTALGPLRVWTGPAGGNYWGEVPGYDRDGDGVVDRAYAPTDALDSKVGRVRGARVLAESPAVTALSALEALVPGLKDTGVIDVRPRTSPARPERLSALNVTVSSDTTA